MQAGTGQRTSLTICFPDADPCRRASMDNGPALELAGTAVDRTTYTASRRIYFRWREASGYQAANELALL